MKALRVTEDILPIATFKAQTSRFLRRLREESRPLVITQNGKPAGVLITPEDFDQLYEHAGFLEAVAAGLADSEAGRVIDDEDLGRELHAEFGPADE